MRKARFTEVQITYALKRMESGKPMGEVCLQLGVRDQPFYRWKRKYQGIGIANLHRLRQLEDENSFRGIGSKARERGVLMAPYDTDQPGKKGLRIML